MLLVNGADGIGTGWSTTVPLHNPLDLIDNLLQRLEWVLQQQEQQEGQQQEGQAAGGEFSVGDGAVDSSMSTVGGSGAPPFAQVLYCIHTVLILHSYCTHTALILR
jgi:DNA gyrase/topoisomerase IV subunit A